MITRTQEQHHSDDESIDGLIENMGDEYYLSLGYVPNIIEIRIAVW